MRALTVRPGTGEPEVQDVAESGVAVGSVLVEGLLLGLCGTDQELMEGVHGEARTRS